MIRRVTMRRKFPKYKRVIVVVGVLARSSKKVTTYKLFRKDMQMLLARIPGLEHVQEVRSIFHPIIIRRKDWPLSYETDSRKALQLLIVSSLDRVNYRIEVLK